MANENNERTEALFEALSRKKKKRRRRIIRTVIAIVLLAAVVIAVAVVVLRRRVNERFADEPVDVLSYQAAYGSISTTVSGSGMLARVDLEELTVPVGVEIDQVVVERDDPITQGQILATVEMSSVISAMADLQTQLEELDTQISEAKDEEISREIAAGVDGRIKIVYAQVGDDVAACMVEHGALAVLSLDGYMAVDITTDALEAGEKVTVTRADGKEISGTVERVLSGVATVLVTDKGPQYDEEVSVTDGEGVAVGGGRLYIHAPLAVTGYAGTVQKVQAWENNWAADYTVLFYLKDTAYSANYETLLRQRGEVEEQLMELLAIYREGAILAPISGIISSVDYSEDTAAEATAQTSYAAALYQGTPTAETGGGDTALVTIDPNVSMSITIGVDETDILSLQLGQQAEITVSSVSEDELFYGEITEINKTASTAAGVTQYSAVVTLPKAEGMLPGMTAEVDVRIEGTQDVIIIPVDALNRTSATYFVYTSYDPATQQYGDRVEVTVGMQNSSYVEIVSGLDVGTTVYYTENDTFNFMDFFTGNMGRGSGGYNGQMPGGFGG